MKELLLKAQDIYEGNKARGFWEGERNKGEALALIHSELDECFEAMCEFDPKTEPKTDYPLEVEELADTAIRILDYLYGFGLLTDERMREVYYRTNCEHLSYRMLLSTHMYVSRALEDIRKGRDEFSHLLNALSVVERFVDKFGHDLLEAIDAKLAYNATRTFKHGKKF